MVDVMSPGLPNLLLWRTSIYGVRQRATATVR